MKGNSHLKAHHVFTIVAFDVCLLTKNGSEGNASSVFATDLKRASSSSFFFFFFKRGPEERKN